MQDSQPLNIVVEKILVDFKWCEHYLIHLRKDIHSVYTEQPTE